MDGKPSHSEAQVMIAHLLSHFLHRVLEQKGFKAQGMKH
jgi:hypothetical protein